MAIVEFKVGFLEVVSFRVDVIRKCFVTYIENLSIKMLH